MIVRREVIKHHKENQADQDEPRSCRRWEHDGFLPGGRIAYGQYEQNRIRAMINKPIEGQYTEPYARPTRSRGWEFLKYFYRVSVSLRARFPFPLIPALFTEKERMLNDAIAFAQFNKTKGDYLEFGTFEGNAFLMAYHLAQSYQLKDMHFYAFDSFEGLPEITGIDDLSDPDPHYKKGELSCSLDRFKTIIRRHNVNMKKTHVVPGFFDKTLNEETKASIPLRSASVVLIDCDLYKSTCDVLEFLTDYLINGTVILFDDWFNYRGDPRLGENRAFREWLESHPELQASQYRTFSWHGNSFIIHR
jgi:O-methyltransferase